ncbi:MAG: hypothetical protein KTR35_20375 [Gammaproteobacteria bacterium]|nr:hypothetical protein [Gammaproteobacteria bacterium]
MSPKVENQMPNTSRKVSTPVINNLKPVMEGLIPAFRDSESGEVHLSLEQNGTLSTDHSFFNLPSHWVSGVNSLGEPMILIPSIEAGYWRSTGFIAIAKQIQLPLDS